ncbi:hypothetical protein F5Y13DRAFT_191151 [Hypoxylon sp. FL1857]|nr:hypothetical protein F5Y13DRAFT_191151 [Hypoxylon sp. FL1857]
MPMRSLRYDSESGQAYSQWVEEPIRRSQTDWYRQQPFIHDQGRSDPGVKGPRSLVDICVHVVAKYLSTCEVEDLDNVPVHLTYRICEYMEKAHLPISLQSHKILARHLSQDKWAGLKTRAMPTVFFKSRHTVERVAGPLSLYTNPLTSASFDFIVQLTLCGADLSISTHDLLGLTKLKNLGVLEIMHPGPSEEASNFPRVTDAVIREWAREPGSFPVLRVLRIWGEDFTTMKSVQYLSSFPSLAIYDVAGRKRDWSDNKDQPAEDFGWCSRGGNSPAGVLLSLSDNYASFDSETAYSFGEAMNRISSESTLAAFEKSPIRKRKRGTKSTEKSNVTPRTVCDDVLYKIKTFVDWSLRKAANKNRGDTQNWGYLLYCYVGNLRSDEDLIAQGVKNIELAPDHGNREVIPRQPFVSVSLGCLPPKKTGRVYEKYRTFARTEYNTKKHQEYQAGAEKSSTPKTYPPRKRRQQVGLSMLDPCYDSYWKR